MYSKNVPISKTQNLSIRNVCQYSEILCPKTHSKQAQQQNKHLNDCKIFVINGDQTRCLEIIYVIWYLHYCDVRNSDQTKKKPLPEL